MNLTRRNATLSYAAEVAATTYVPLRCSWMSTACTVQQTLIVLLLKWIGLTGMHAARISFRYIGLVVCCLSLSRRDVRSRWAEATSTVIISGGYCCCGDWQGGTICGVTIRVGRFFKGMADIIDDLLFNATPLPGTLLWYYFTINATDNERAEMDVQ